MDTPESSENKPWQWLTASPTRMVGLILLVLALVLLLALMVLVSQKPPKKKTEVNVPQPSPTVLPTSLPDPTQNWLTLTNINDFRLKYPSNSQLTPPLPQATSSASLSITTGQSILAVEVVDKKQTLKQMVDLVRQKNATSSGSIQINKVITKPIPILIGGNEGYEWYLESNGLTGITTTFNTKLGKNRIIHLKKGDKFYTILASLDKEIEQILNTLTIL